jgi:hypothetical protein
MYKPTIPALLVVGVALIATLGCAADDPSEQASDTEQASEETTETAATDPDQEIIERCQGDPTNVWDEDKTLEEQVLGSEGYDPTDEPSAGTKYVALQEMREHPEKDWCGGFTPVSGPYDIAPANEIEAQMQAAIHEQQSEAQRKATGKNEAGQDVSNIPKTPRDPQRGACLKAYYDALPPSERGPESQRVTAEANSRGVSPYDVVGC